MPNSIMLSSSRAGRRPARELDSVIEYSKFHYAIQVGDLVADLVSDQSQTGSSYLDMSRDSSILVANLFRPYSITLSSPRADRRPARELDSAMKFGLILTKIKPIFIYLF